MSKADLLRGTLDLLILRALTTGSLHGLGVSRRIEQMTQGTFVVGAGSLFLWLVINVQVYCVLRAFGLGLPLSAAFVTTSAAVLGLVVPTPGGVGGYHAAVQFALTRVYGVPLATATGVALIAHAVSFVPISLIGFALFATSPIRRSGWKQLSSSPETPQKPAELG